jgi:probable HAF family extracellular repeat protein
MNTYQLAADRMWFSKKRYVRPLLIAGVLLSLSAVRPTSAQQYEIVDLGTLGGNSSRANGISESGIIVGLAALPSSAQHSVIWDESGIVDMGLPPGSFGTAVAVNDAGQVACYGEGNPQTYQAFFWENGIWTPTGVLPGHSESIARDIDSAGRIVGSSFILGQEHRAVMWDAGVVTDLGTLGGSSNAYGINDAGQVVGYSLANLPDGELGLRGFLWENGEMTALEPLPGEVATEAYDVNDAGDVVGSSWWYTTQFFSAKGAALWPNGSVEAIDLGFVPAPPGSCSENPYWHKSIARAINNCGQIVGEAMCIASGAPKAAFLWQDGVIHNLEDLIPSGTGWTLKTALDINDAGQIVGYGLIAPNDQHLRAFLLEPLSPPSCPIAPSDLNGDGSVGPADLAILLGSWGPCPAEGDCPADLDGDGIVGAADLAILLGAWG